VISVAIGDYIVLNRQTVRISCVDDFSFWSSKWYIYVTYNFQTPLKNSV